MLKRHLIAAALAATAAGAAAPALVHAAPPPPAAATLSPEDKTLVDRAAAYLDGLTQARAEFVQTDARGNVSRGELFLNRPGKARFEYQPPSSMIVVANGHTVTVYNQRLQTFDSYPLASTPLALFLQKQVRLDGKVVITRVERSSGGFRLTARDAKHPGRGEITLTFSDEPMALKQWSIVDSQGARTTVQINDLRPTSGLDPSLFELRGPNAEIG
jgi:outer membrane lipoprotein-sorting protein